MPPIIDGVLGSAWDAAERTSLWENCSGEAPVQSTWFRALWDEQALYVAFECEDNDIWGDMTEHDAPIYEQEVVEVFIDANSDGIGYMELEVSPLNTVFDLYMLLYNGRRKGLLDWDCQGLQTAVSVEGDATRRGSIDKCWVVEMAIPLAELLTAPHIPPQSGDVWRTNFYRIDRPVTGGWELSAWSPTGREDFHMPERFGRFMFVL